MFPDMVDISQMLCCQCFDSSSIHVFDLAELFSYSKIVINILVYAC